MLSLLDLIQLPGQDIDSGLGNVRTVGEDDEDRDGEKGQEDVNEGGEGAAHGPGRL